MQPRFVWTPFSVALVKISGCFLLIWRFNVERRSEDCLGDHFNGLFLLLEVILWPNPCAFSGIVLWYPRNNSPQVLLVCFMYQECISICKFSQMSVFCFCSCMNCQTTRIEKSFLMTCSRSCKREVWSLKFFPLCKFACETIGKTTVCWNARKRDGFCSRTLLHILTLTVQPHCFFFWKKKTWISPSWGSPGNSEFSQTHSVQPECHWLVSWFFEYILVIQRYQSKALPMKISPGVKTAGRDTAFITCCKDSSYKNEI